MGIALLIFSLVHTPLPQPDFHNIRHHHAAGEVCEHHDHLLRWHPGAGFADDVAVLHWHWFLPVSGTADATPADPWPALHAHVSDDIASTWDDGPRILPDDHSRLVGRDETRTATAFLPFLPADPAAAAPARAIRRASATAAPRATLTSLLQRWIC